MLGSNIEIYAVYCPVTIDFYLKMWYNIRVKPALFYLKEQKRSHNKRWTKQNLHKVYYSYWNDNGGMYSWRKHGEQINAVRKSISAINTYEAMAA